MGVFSKISVIGYKLTLSRRLASAYYLYEMSICHRCYSVP